MLKIPVLVNKVTSISCVCVCLYFGVYTQTAALQVWSGTTNEWKFFSNTSLIFRCGLFRLNFFPVNLTEQKTKIVFRPVGVMHKHANNTFWVCPFYLQQRSMVWLCGEPNNPNIPKGPSPLYVRAIHTQKIKPPRIPHFEWLQVYMVSLGNTLHNLQSVSPIN